MWKSRSLLAGLLALGATAALAAGGRPTSTGFVAFDRGMYRLAASEIRQALADNPDSPDLHAMLAVSMAELGIFRDASVEFEFAVGNSLDESTVVSSWGDTLRIVGQGARAAELRRERLLSPLSEDSEMLIWVSIADDLRAVGDLAGAEDAAWQAITVAPNAPSAHYALAEVLLAEGDLAGAEAEVWIASLRGETTMRGRVTEARVALAKGDTEWARGVLFEGMRGPLRSWRIAVLRAALARAEGRSDEAEHWLYSQTFGIGEWPELLAMRAVVAAEAGRMTEAEEDLAKVEALYPDNADVRAAGAIIARLRAPAP